MNETNVSQEPATAEPAVAQKPKKAEKPRVEPQPVAPHVYRAIVEVKEMLAETGGITKDRKADFGDRYSFRGIDDMYNVLCGVTARAGLIMIPRVVGQRIETEDRANGRGKQVHAYLTVEVDFISSVDGTRHTGCFVGEAIDTSDKACNKALSAAFKYAHLTVFQIPTEGRSDDTENDNYDVGDSDPRQPAIVSGTKGRPADAMHPDVLRAICEKVDVASTFAGLHAIVTGGEPLPPIAIERVHARAIRLLTEAPNVKELNSSKALIQELGQPQALMTAYNTRYKALRQQAVEQPKPATPVPNEEPAK